MHLWQPPRSKKGRKHSKSSSACCLKLQLLCQLGKGGGHIPDAQTPRYRRFFKACCDGDAAAITELTGDAGCDDALGEVAVWVTVKEVR